MKAPAIRRLILFVAMVPVLLANSPIHSREYFLPRPDMQKYAVILGGAAANETYRAQFRQWSLKLHEILVRDYGYPPDNITLLLDRGDSGMSMIDGPCRLNSVMEAMGQLRKTVQPGDQINIFFIGHGTSDDQAAKFVLVGPDITGAEFAKILEEFSNQDIVVMNTTSSSHPFCAALSAPGRVVVCATRSAAERYDTIFARFLLEALENHAADRDKNRRVSPFEAFLYVRENIKTWYTDQDRLPSEHPTLGDNGDGRFHTDPDPARNEGRLAQIADFDTLAVSFSETGPGGGASEALRKQTAKVQALERSVILLRHQKSEMPDQDYRHQLETLLIDLARSSRQLRILRADQHQYYPMDE